MTPSPAVAAVGLTKRFGNHLAVDDITFTVPDSQAVGLLGHNGAGKTTLIRLMLGLTPPDAGHVELSGQRLDPHAPGPLARVGAMVEEPRFHPHLSGRANLEVVAAVRGRRALARVPAALARVSWTGTPTEPPAPTRRGCASASGSPPALYAGHSS